MSTLHTRWIQILAATALTAGLVACGPSNTEQTAGQRLDNAVDATKDAANNAIDATKDASAQAMDATKDAANDAMAAASSASINAKVNSALIGDPELSSLSINVDVTGGEVTLHGTAPNASAKERAESLAKAVEGVTSVNNQLAVP